MIAESAALGGEPPPAPAPWAVMPGVRRDGSYRKSKRQRTMPSEQKVRQEPDLVQHRVTQTFLSVPKAIGVGWTD